MLDVKSYTVGNGDMFYIKHGNDIFTIIECQLFGDHKECLVDELKADSKWKGITRFISTHPDEDHIQGLEYLDEKMPIVNFYVVQKAPLQTAEWDASVLPEAVMEGGRHERSVQRPALRTRHHPALHALVLPVRAQLPRPQGDG